MLLSVRIRVHLLFLFIDFYYRADGNPNTINRACSVGGSTCGVDQACVNERCECDPKNNRFWTGEKLGCRVCPRDYIRRRE